MLPADYSEGSIRLSVFLGVLLLLLLAEALWPRRPLRIGRKRWSANLAIVALGAVVVRLMAAASLPLVAIAAALWAESTGIGLFQVIKLPVWLTIVLTWLALDALVWAQHWLFHRLPMFWRIHRVHHADQDIDVTTALRFHPLEIAISMLIKVVAVLLLGAPVIGVLIFEITLNGFAMFNHANLRLPLWLDRMLRWLVVTPDMHRVHHSVQPGEHHRNFGFCLSLWDRLFGSYRAQPAAGHQQMQIGLSEYQGEGPTHLAWCLMLPIKKS